MVEDEGGDVAGMGIAVADEATALGGLVDGGFEDPEVLLRLAQRELRRHMDARAMIPFRDPEQVSMTDVLLCLNYLFLADGLISQCSLAPVHGNLVTGVILSHQVSIIEHSSPRVK